MTTEYLIGCYHPHDGSAVSQLPGEGQLVLWEIEDFRTSSDRMHPLSENCPLLDWSPDVWWVVCKSDELHDIAAAGPWWVSGKLLCNRPWREACAWLARNQLPVPRHTPVIDVGGATQTVHSADGIAIASVDGRATTHSGAALAPIAGAATATDRGLAFTANGEATAGVFGVAIAATGTARAARGGIAFCRTSGFARAACHGLAIAGDECDAHVDGQGIAIAGYGGRASVGDLGLAICTGRLRFSGNTPAGVRAGLGGVLIMYWFDPLIGRCRPCVAVVDGERIKADTLYTCVSGEFVEAIP